MMKSDRLTAWVKDYSGDLRVTEESPGLFVIQRKTKRHLPFNVFGSTWYCLFEVYENIARGYFTEDWSAEGKPVEWGYLPVWQHLSWLDGHRDDSYYQRILDNRERKEKDKQRTNKNQFRAVAADMRSSFAKSTNDIVVRR